MPTFEDLSYLVERAISSISSYVEKPHMYTVLTHLAVLGLVCSIFGFTSFVPPLFLTIAVVANYYKKECINTEKTNQLLQEQIATQRTSYNEMQNSLNEQLASQNAAFAETKTLLTTNADEQKEANEALIKEIKSLRESNESLRLFLADFQGVIESSSMGQALENAISGSIEKYGMLRALSLEEFNAIALVFNQMHAMNKETNEVSKKTLHMVSEIHRSMIS